MEFKDELRKYTERLENIKDTLQTTLTIGLHIV